MTKRTTQRRKTEVRGYRSSDASCEGTAVRTRSRNLCLYGLAPLSLYVAVFVLSYSLQAKPSQNFDLRLRFAGGKNRVAGNEGIRSGPPHGLDGLP